MNTYEISVIYNYMLYIYVTYLLHICYISVTLRMRCVWHISYTLMLSRPDAAVDVAFFSPHKLLGGPGSVGLLVAKKRRDTAIVPQCRRRAKSQADNYVIMIFDIYIYWYILILFANYVDSCCLCHFLCRFHFVSESFGLTGWGCCEMPCLLFLVVE